MKKVLLMLAVALLAVHGRAEEKKAQVKPIKEVFEPKGNFPADKYWKVAVVQWNPGEDVEVGIPKKDGEASNKNHREEMGEFVKEAAKNGAKYVALSEFAVVGYPDIPDVPSEEDNFRNRDDIAPYVEKIPGDTSKFFGALAKKLDVWIQYGTAEEDPQTKNYHNVAVVVNNRGELVAKYRKQNLFHVEENFLVPGNENVTFETPAGKFGLIICSDSYDYNVLRKYASMKVDVLALSTSWAEMNTGMTHFRHAATYTHAYLLAANQNYFPDSGVINPDGKNQSHIRQTRDAIAYGYLPLKGKK